MATRKLVPRADLEGGIGTAAKRWASGYFATLFVGAVAVAAPYYEKHVVTAGEAGTGIIDLIVGTYTTGDDSLMVFLNGQLQTITDDYAETDSDTVTFAAGRIAENDVVIFRQ